MMHRISQETPLEFIRRNGPTLTHEVAQRFRMRHVDALRALKALEKAGGVKSRRAAFSHGAGHEWTALTSGQCQGAE